MISTTLYSGYRLGNFYHNFQTQKIQKQEQQLNRLYEKLSVQKSQLNMLEVELNIEQLANDNAKNFIKELEQNTVDLKTELAFFEKIMAPENEIDGIVLDDFKVRFTNSERRFLFESIVIQQQKSKRYAKGYIELEIVGSLNSESQKLPLSDISTLQQKDLSFSFKFFQHIEGYFTLPEGFIPEKVLVSVVLPKGRWQKFKQLNKSFLWSEVVEN